MKNRFVANLECFLKSRGMGLFAKHIIAYKNFLEWVCITTLLKLGSFDWIEFQRFGDDGPFVRRYESNINGKHLRKLVESFTSVKRGKVACQFVVKSDGEGNREHSVLIFYPPSENVEAR